MTEAPEPMNLADAQRLDALCRAARVSRNRFENYVACTIIFVLVFIAVGATLAFVVGQPLVIVGTLVLGISTITLMLLSAKLLDSYQLDLAQPLAYVENHSAQTIRAAESTVPAP